MDVSQYRSSPLYAVHHKWAIETARRFRCRFPNIKISLFSMGDEFQIFASGRDDGFEILEKHLDDFRTVTCPLRPIKEIPNGVLPIDESEPYEAELWLYGSPFNVSDLNRLMFLADGKLPEGTLDYVHDPEGWEFSSPTPLSMESQHQILVAARKIVPISSIRFVTTQVCEEKSSPKSRKGAHDGLELIISRSREIVSTRVRGVVEADEDAWREFLRDRADQKIVGMSSPPPRTFTCLFDAADRSDIRLSELLTLYDRIDVIPDKNDPNWMGRHKVTVKDFQELVRLGRCRLVIPYSANQCDAYLMDALCDVDPSSIILSRSLAMKTIETGQCKDPLLYAPLSAIQRAGILGALYESSSDPRFLEILESYGEIFQNQHHAFMMNGACANITSGIGRYLGDAIYKTTGRDARIELSIAGAGIEWALSLGASYIPRKFGEGYDETNNCNLIASFLGRTQAKQVDPVAERMHLLVEGLLAVADIPPLEVARNFHSAAEKRFKGLAAKLMHQAPSREEMSQAVSQINADVKAFEGRTSSLRKWKLDTLGVGVTAKYVNDLLDANVPYGSVLAAWFYEILKNKVPNSLKDELSFASQMIIGLAASPSLDAVIVSRSRKDLR